MTLVEMLVAMMLLSVVMVVTLIAYTQSRQVFVRTDDEATGQTDVRRAVERLGRDVRSGRQVEPGANASSLQIWIDRDSDYRREADEIVTWQLVARAPGEFDVTRTLDGTTTVTATSVIDGLAFCYKAASTDPTCLPMQPSPLTGLSATDAARTRIVETTMVYDSKLGVGSRDRTLRVTERMRNVG